jgi:lipid-A-disaccharide synthase
MKKIFVITGEASGDIHGANLIQALRRKNANLAIYGVGGKHMADQDLIGFLNMAHLNATGLTDILAHLPQYFAAARVIIKDVKSLKPDLIIFIDNPGFNLRLAKKLHGLGIPMAYYICPQVWAWNENRVQMMKKIFKKALVIFDFEKPFFEARGLPATWVGHPLMDQYEISKEAPRPPGVKNILLMPGSRAHEVRRLLPIMLDAMNQVIKHSPHLKITLIKAHTLTDEFYDGFLKNSSLTIESIRDNKNKAIREADLGLVCSGTATLECTLMGMPMIILYKTSAITYWIGKKLVKVPFLGIPNILSGKLIVPELLQDQCTAVGITRKMRELMTNPGMLDVARVNLKAATLHLGQPGAPDRAADEVLSLIA